MISSIGLDAVEIVRFGTWHTYSVKSLQKIFTLHEIEYCLSNPQKSSERFAVRFAVREAFFKAYSSLQGTPAVPFLFLCKKIFVQHTLSNVPALVVAWAELGYRDSLPQVLISLTHTQTTAIAVVVLIKK